MYEVFIKEWLLSKQSKVYSVIVETYRQKLEDLKPTLFRKWLAKEISIPEENINLSSLNSALVRQRKRDEKSKPKGNNSPPINPADITQQKDAFTFSSSVENSSPAKRTIEL